MKIRTLDGARLYRGFSAGALNVRARQEVLNSMNVFPVPDGDTGTNLAATVQSVSEGTVISRSLSETSSSMADAALIGARGNSGLIFAQFLYGFSEGSGGREELDVKAFGRAVSGAIPYAREALSKPVEGTILTVMEDWASEVGGRITVIDSRTASAPLGLLVMRAAQALNEGKGHEETVSLIETGIPGAKIFVSLRTLKYMVRGGRVSPAKGLLATLLNLKPIITVDEEGFARSFGQTRGWEANVNKIREIIDQECRKARVCNYCIVHAHSPASAEAAASGMRETVGRDPAYVMDISPVLGAHSGIGSVAVGILME
ncbi:MAG TPA: hypothetical protein DCM24_01375 [Synergistaceae bacterium]|nr:hypothetical protein [Synergistaceae bacterium]